MKAFKLVREMLFLTIMFSACCAEIPVTVLCSLDWFMVTVHPFMWNDDVYVHFYELHLGLGCPPNYVQPHIYQFTYRVTECGIRVKAVSPDMIIYSTELHYASKDTSSKYVIPVSCTTPRHSPWLTVSHSRRVASQSAASAHNGEMRYPEPSLSLPSQRAHCDCRFCVFSEEHVQAPHRQAEAQEACPVQSSYFSSISED
ncbi:Placenta-specific protein 1 [Heterocephalus glaber]|uniref:Placenta-specific protein 1 n=1 Tax=Heterocephalus glaber TaxID=10181 RepID=G5C257_HETGA|nr:placenta-specific protein 1 [Heterocephalus glaber]EHB15618.1 Placenta-specific protein 1 [Heterocephalus glaber]